MLSAKKHFRFMAFAITGLLSLPMGSHAAISKTEANISQTAPSVIAFNQKLKNDQVSVTYAYLPSDGFLVVYGAEEGNRRAKPLGRTELKAGDHRDVTVKLDAAPSTGSALWVSISNRNKESYWPKTLPLENKFKVE